MLSALWLIFCKVGAIGLLQPLCLFSGPADDFGGFASVMSSRQRPSDHDAISLLRLQVDSGTIVLIELVRMLLISALLFHQLVSFLGAQLTEFYQLLILFG